MADDVALRSRRSRLHRRGDHTLCKPERCEALGGRGAALTELKAVPKADKDLVETYRARLAEAGKLDTPQGVHVMTLAKAFAAGGFTASAMAALSKELRQAFTDVLKDSPKASDGMDELAARRARKAAGA